MFLQFREELDANGHRILYKFCEKCKLNEKCLDFKLYFKEYVKKQTETTMKYNLKSTKDITLASKKSTCPKCLITSENVYEKKYIKNRFFLNHICSRCYHNW